MALILNIETATTVCSVALAKDGQLISHKEINEGYTHSENLTVFIEEVLKEAEIKISELDAVAVSKGPGSYTGLRIGVSTAKGLCFALEKPLIAIPTLLVMTERAKSCISPLSSPISYLFCPMIDARRMEVYCALYDENLNAVKNISAEIIDENSFSEFLSKSKICFFGDGSTKCKPEIIHPNAVFLENIFPSAKNMIELSKKAFTEKRFEDVAYFEPYYLKDFVAGKKKS